MLHVTNGDIAVERMRDGGLRGEYLPWRDVLYEGPVPPTDTLEQLSAIRARHLAACGFGEEMSIAADFRSRDAALGRCADHEEIVLWFEHDLYDQLQLLQVLDSLARKQLEVPVSLIVVGSYPGIERFVGLGQLSPAQLVGLLDSRIPAIREQFEVAKQAWAAFRRPDPAALAAMYAAEMLRFPTLHRAVRRLLEELPSVGNGLSRTECNALGIVAQGIEHPRGIFAGAQELEQQPFMGDWSFWRMLALLAEGAEPMLETYDGRKFSHPPRGPDGPAFEAQRLRLTRAGQDVLENRRDAVKLRRIDRWLGGTRLRPGNIWRWEGEKQQLKFES